MPMLVCLQSRVFFVVSALTKYLAVGTLSQKTNKPATKGGVQTAAVEGAGN